MSEHDRGEGIGWLLENWTARLADSLEGMTGERPLVASRDAEGAPDPADMLWWEQPLSLGAQAIFWAGAPRAAWVEIGSQVLRGAGIEVTDPQDAKNTYLEALSQACSGLAQAITRRVGRETACEKGAEKAPPAAGSRAFEIDVTLAGSKLPPLRLALPAGAQEWFQAAGERPALAAAAGLSVPAAGPPAPKPEEPRTLDLLLELELPVSVSFGRAQLALKDVLKLTSGSIVELSRTITEPVEVIVNNFVIARGEVVVVEGNYGVRIQEIISRDKRLRTLQ
jgi:flagellar motor switch protein FliN/FliY